MSARRFTRAEVECVAANLWRCMSLTRAARMCGVSPGQVARWRDGARLTDRMARQVAASIVARDLGMVGTFGTIDTRGARIVARMDSHGVVVRVTETTNERGGA